MRFSDELYTCNYFRISVPVPNPDCGAPLIRESGKKKNVAVALITTDTNGSSERIYIYLFPSARIVVLVSTHRP
jgi:hypothetical protein